jgi:hypothetical protein
LVISFIRVARKWMRKREGMRDMTVIGIAGPALSVQRTRGDKTRIPDVDEIIYLASITAACSYLPLPPLRARWVNLAELSQY